ncbi:class I SAM-dependent methyltransferase [Paenibacillus tarimensis]
MKLNEIIRSNDDILTMLDSIVSGTPGFWDKFYSDRNRQVPFFVNSPDENLVSYVNKGQIPTGKALDLGCGPGRNAIFLAKSGFDVDAVDYSEEAIHWAQERADALGISVRFICKSVFELDVLEQYDFVYDSGCMHHLLPHRRVQYIAMIRKGLKPEGLFGITCFASGHEGEGGPVKEMTDWDVYRERTTNGGLAFSEEKIRALFSVDFESIELRKMEQVKESELDEVFGVSFLWTSLWKKR